MTMLHYNFLPVRSRQAQYTTQKMSEDYSQVGIKADAGAGASPGGEENETQNVLTGDGTELCEVSFFFHSISQPVR